MKKIQTGHYYNFNGHYTYLFQNQCVQVLHKDKQILLWVVFSSNIQEGQIACNALLNRLVGLDEGSDVFVSPYGDIKVIDELFVDTDSPDDQEILVCNCYR